MNTNDFIAGKLKKGYQYEYFLPEKINHSFVWTDETINELLEKASLKLGELNSFSRFVPDTDMFIRMHIFKEAVVSSRIEGTQTNIEEALVEEKEVDPEKRDDWKEVNNYVAAMNSAIDELDKLPLSNRLIKNTHKILLSSARGNRKDPGHFRQSQNWIGGASLSDAVFIPPAHIELPEYLEVLSHMPYKPYARYLVDRGFSSEYFVDWDAFYCYKGTFNGYIVFPIIVGNTIVTFTSRN